jgi:hypothetical protein
MFLTIFANVLLPLILVTGAAFLLGKRSNTDPAALARVVFYLFNPCLVYVSLSTTTIAAEMLGQMAVLKLLGYAVMWPLARFSANRLRLAQPAANAFVMAALFANSGNFGLPVNEYAFGRNALALAVISFITDNLMVNTLGVYLAARGRASARQAALEVARNPAIYAIALGLAAHEFGWVTPLPLARALDLLNRAATPAMLVVLGLQLARLQIDRKGWGAAGAASALRLAVTPLVMLGLVTALGITGAARQVGITQAAAPTAVSAGIVASRYDAAPGFVATAVLLSSLIGLVSVTAILAQLVM